MSREVIADVLKQYRNARGFSIAYVCEWLTDRGHDIKPKTLYSYETGHRQPDADLLMKMCELYGIEDVLKAFGYGDIGSSSGLDPLYVNGRQKILLSTCESLNDDGLDKVIEYASDLVASEKYRRKSEKNQAM